MQLEKAAFGMGCFWGPEALFGSLDGVIRTRVGYAGGEKEDPTYDDLGGHTETVLVEYDPEKIGYEDLLDVFWENHDFRSYRKPQYASKIFYVNAEQKDIAGAMIQNYPDAETEIQPLENFTVAEDYHQKYRLRHSGLMEHFEDSRNSPGVSGSPENLRFSNMSDKELRNSPLAAKANAVAAGKLDRDELDLD
ncbi:MAG: peptide-methionine (S)-S-oxide reductase MsrA [Candidatus Nanohaloarchaea archaeon]